MSSTVSGDAKIVAKLEEQAWAESDAFCYTDYIVVKPDANGNTFCPRCHSDDLMRHVQGAGVEYGIEWVMAHIVRSEFELIPEGEIEEMTEEFIDELNPAVKIGNLTFSASRILEELDECTFDEWTESQRESLLESGDAVEVDDELYRVPALF